MEARKNKDYISFKDSWVGQLENIRVLQSFLISVIISWNYLRKLKELSTNILVDTGVDCLVFNIDFVKWQLLP